MSILKSISDLFSKQQTVQNKVSNNNFQNNLLSYFELPRLITGNKVFRRWEEPKKQKIEPQLQPLITQGLLRQTTDIEFLIAVFKATELKTIAKKLSLPTSGTKEELSAKITPLYSIEINQLRKKNKTLIASDLALPIISAYNQYEENRLSSALSASRIHLENGQIMNAIKIKATYDEGNVFPNTQALPWDEQLIFEFTEDLKPVFTRTPKYLLKHKLGVEIADRLNAAMSIIWGPVCNIKINLSKDTLLVLNSLETQHFYLKNIKFPKTGLPIYTTYFNCNDNLVCPECRKLENRKFLTKNAPELPLENCSCETGCRCWATSSTYL